MADIRISAADLALLSRTTFTIQRANEFLAPDILQRISTRLQSVMQAAVEHVDRVADGLRVFDPSSRRELRHALETASGATAGVARASALAATLPDPRMRLAVLAAGAAFGALEGARLEEIREQITRAHYQVARETAALERRIRAIDLDLNRLRAARRRTGRLG